MTPALMRFMIIDTCEIIKDNHTMSCKIIDFFIVTETSIKHILFEYCVFFPLDFKAF